VQESEQIVSTAPALLILTDYRRTGWSVWRLQPRVLGADGVDHDFVDLVERSGVSAFTILRRFGSKEGSWADHDHVVGCGRSPGGPGGLPPSVRP
jgi:hypothetical protein